MRVKLFITLLFILVVVTGCVPRITSKNEAGDSTVQLNNSEKDITIFLIQGEYLVPVTVQKEQLGPSTPADAVYALMSWNAPEWAVSPLPLSTEIHRVISDGDIAIIDLKETASDSLSGGTLSETLLLQSLVLTLTGLKGIDQVQFLVEGEVSEAAFGHLDTTLPLNPPVAYNIEQPLPSGEVAFIRLWFADQHGMFTVPVSRAVAKKDYNFETAVQELLRGPQTGSPLFSPFPEGTKVRSISIDSKICTIDFSHELVSKYIGGSAGERLLLQSLVLTLTEFPEIEQVQMLVEGKREEALLGHLETLQPLERSYPNPFK